MKTVEIIIVFLISIVMGIAIGFFAAKMMPSGGPPTMGQGGMDAPAVDVQLAEMIALDTPIEHIGKVEPIQEVNVSSEVAGYVTAVHFEEGAQVNEGDLLFTIDQRQYQATVQVRQAELAQAQAELSRADKYLKRLQAASEKGVSRSDLDTAESDQLQAAAALKQAEANLNLAEIDLAYTEIRAPISGRIGRALVTKGNYVSNTSDSLARIVQLNPIRVVFSLPDRIYYDLMTANKTDLVGQLRLPDGSTFGATGHIDFEDNEIRETTGTLAMRYAFPNDDGTLVPGTFVTVLLGEQTPTMGLAVSQRAVLTDSDGSYVLVADERGLIREQRIQTGKTVGSMIEVTTGLKTGEQVVVEGLQKVQPGTTAAVTITGAEL
jgi:RND family efflux transporter MFP subunit